MILLTGLTNLLTMANNNKIKYDPIEKSLSNISFHLDRTYKQQVKMYDLHNDLYKLLQRLIYEA